MAASKEDEAEPNPCIKTITGALAAATVSGDGGGGEGVDKEQEEELIPTGK